MRTAEMLYGYLKMSKYLLHDKNLNEAVECTRSVCIEPNFDKCVIKTEYCGFFGNLYTPDRVKPDHHQQAVEFILGCDDVYI